MKTQSLFKPLKPSADQVLTIVADENMPQVDHWFRAHKIRFKAGRAISKADLMDAQVLLVRSVTQVNESLLAGTPVQFVGSATIGTDHVDQSWLANQGIRFAHSPGCNAQGVVDYVIAGLYHFQQQTGQDWTQLTIGIVGVGNVGGALAQRLHGLGVKLKLCDPLRQQQQSHWQPSIPFEPLDSVLTSDIICLHTPLTTASDSPYPTQHLINQDTLQAVKPGALLINAGRGPVIEEAALLARLGRGDLAVILDVWEFEPQVNLALMAQCLIATPHIAGYSLDGKIRGTYLLYEQFSDWIGQPISPLTLPGEVWSEANLAQPKASELIRQVYDIQGDDERTRSALNGEANQGKRAEVFDQLRKRYPVRREFGSALLPANWQQQFSAEQLKQLQALGFKTRSDR